MARLMTTSPRWPSPSLAPSGTVRASLASGIKRTDRRWKLGHEGTIRQTGALRDLYEGLYRATPPAKIASLSLLRKLARPRRHLLARRRTVGARRQSLSTLPPASATPVLSCSLRLRLPRRRPQRSC